MEITMKKGERPESRVGNFNVLSGKSFFIDLCNSDRFKS